MTTYSDKFSSVESFVHMMTSACERKISHAPIRNTHTRAGQGINGSQSVVMGLVNYAGEVTGGVNCTLMGNAMFRPSLV